MKTNKREAKKSSTEKNMKKFDGYKEAFNRISTSISGRYFFEAVTIEESIITDRILSYFKNKSSESKFKSLQNIFLLCGKLSADSSETFCSEVVEHTPRDQKLVGSKSVR